MRQFSLFDSEDMIDYPDRLRQIRQQLTEHYGTPVPTDEALDPLSQLIVSILSQRTQSTVARAVFDDLRERYPDWYDLMLAPVPEIEEAIAACTWPEQKAPRLKEVLMLINERYGRLSLDFLEKTNTKAAHDWLKDIPGVGPKTAASVLALSTLQRRILPVDSHHHRVSLRLGLLPPKTAAEPAHKLLEDQLPPDWEAADVCNYHALIKIHGQQTCTFNYPRCTRCTLLTFCPHGQTRIPQKESKA